jgi:hypothetical protein
MDERTLAALNETVESLTPGAVIVVETSDSRRKLTVESLDVPDWADYRASVTLTLSGEDGPYLLWSNGDHGTVPWLCWESLHPHSRAVVDLTIVSPGTPIASDTTAADLGIPKR